MQIRIVVCRHPEKDGDKITAKGAMQAWAAALALGERGFKFVYLAHSGAHRALQAAKVMAAALDLDPRDEGDPMEHEGFHFQGVFDRYFAGDAGRDRFFAEQAALNEAHGGQATLADALAHTGDLGCYANDGHDSVESALGNLAFALTDKPVGVEPSEIDVLVLSHSPWTELAVLDPASVPFGLGEADAVCYTLDDREPMWIIAASELIRAPLAGKGSYK